ncbi:RNAse P Rpr2/Rpp21/SNM1 subunit domain-containing protein [Aspergillus bertholletiae]|uniref:RNAse P Rpr2/Rpp21/SNM1 subunit domain-containing protein n=1 Tax=Aspergillus bertholletiae TaxID=1226010 RepID=A0A5N7B190_9EURO|nr:RNAse P Rpr2/Rpp21/SNM1 subunit domain-containing protein [Aspergillus bertholletiae]
MAKAKGKKGSSGGAQSHTRARLDYLYNAAIYLQSAGVASQQSSSRLVQNVTSQDGEVVSTPGRVVPHLLSHNTTAGQQPTSADVSTNTKRLPQLSRTFISQMRGVSLKTQLRLPVKTKRSFCKRCDTLLSPGISCIQEIRNESRDRKKPWADIRVIRCATCGTEKRFPQTEKRAKKLSERRKLKEQEKEHAPAP